MINKPPHFETFIILLVILTFIFSHSSFLFAYTQIPEALCEMGIKLYQQGRYDEALHEFRKALLASPEYAPALKYIQMIEQTGTIKEEKKEIIPATFKPTVTTSAGAIKELLDLIEIQREMILERQKAPVIEKILAPQILSLDEYLREILQPIEIEQGKSLVIRGKNIKRFLVTQPNVLIVEKQGADELLITGKDIGYTYVHVWDDNGRWTTEFLAVLPKPEGPTADELMRLEEERIGTFKLRYSLDWHLFEQGRRINSLNRQTYSWYHSLNLTGATPHGNLDSTATIRALRKTTDLTYFTLGLNEGKWGPFKGFTLRGFDFYPGFSNLAFGGGRGVSLRGAMLKSPAFDEKIDYTTFWGREGGGRYGNLSPGLQKTKNSFINGLDVNFYPLDDTNLGLTVVHGYGRDRPGHLNHYAYDSNANWRIADWKMGYEIGYDSETFAHLLDGNYTKPKVNFTYELRNIDKDFLTITGETWRRGERGGLFSLNYVPHTDWNINQRLDVYQDRLFPSPEDNDRWNEDYNFEAHYAIDPTATLRFDYTLQNQLGKVSQIRYQSPGIGFSKSFNFIRRIGSYINYRHQESKNYTGPSSDYINENVSMGIRFNLIGQLYYFLNKQWNWLEEKFVNSHFRPHALETGLDLSSQILNSPFYENIRFIYRDEENATSALSFLSGEDYIEGYAELSYRPSPDKEAYCSTRIRNVWAENPNANKRLEADFNAGMRYLWDTGVRWESVGNIEGYVFKDLNSDGLRQRDEAPVEGIKIWLGKKSTTTDIFGYYKFSHIKGKKAFVAIETQDLPAGFVLTVPQKQEVDITHGGTLRIDFGIASRSEIAGTVFYDANGDGEYNAGENGIKDVILTLENAVKTTTDSSGRYLFRNVSEGEHIITLDLKSIPLDYLPQVSLSKKITLFEGVTYIYNIPLKKIK